MDSRFPKILGTAVINEKGQVVIPVEARTTMRIAPGSRVVIMSVPNKDALMILKAEEVEAMVKNFTDALNSKEENK
jgi:AbrB family looped-hinge helix DNA binding protein